MRKLSSLIFLLIILFSPAALGSTMEAKVTFKQGYTAFTKADYYQAITQLKLSLEDHSYPLRDYSFFYIGKSYELAKSWDYAVQVYAMLLDYEPNSVLVPQAMFGLASAQSKKGETEATIATLQHLLANYPREAISPQARFLLGQQLEEQGDLEDAARVYRNIDMIHPKNIYAEKALDRLEKLAKEGTLAKYEAPAASIFNKGMKYFNRKSYTKAKGYFTKLSRFYKRSSFYDEALIMLGRIQLRKGKIPHAVSYFKKAINQSKDSKPEAMYYLGRSYGYLNSPKAAIQTLTKTIKMFPNSNVVDSSLYYIAYYSRQIGQPEHALATFEELVTDKNKSELSAKALWLIGDAYYKQKNYAQAYEYFSQSLTLPKNRTSDQLLFWTGKCAQKLDNRDQAIRAWQLTIKNFDHSYYSYRAREELKKAGIAIKFNEIPQVTEIIKAVDGTDQTVASHAKKHQELFALGLTDLAEVELSFIEDKAPAKEKDKIMLSKYHSYIMKGKFAKPIHFADKKITEAMKAGDLEDMDPRLWRFSYPRGYWQYVEKYSKKYGLDPYLVYAVIREESRFKSRALSHASAHGLMQVIPSTGRLLSRSLGMSYSRWKMYNPRVNIEMGTYFLAKLVKRFNGNVSLALAGYNGGPNRVSRWLKKTEGFDLDQFVEDIPLYETRNYVKKVMRSYYGYKRTYSGG